MGYPDALDESLLEAVENRVPANCIWGILGIHPRRTGNLHGTGKFPFPILFLNRRSLSIPDDLARELGEDKLLALEESRFYILYWEDAIFPDAFHRGDDCVRQMFHRLQIALRICGVTFRWYDILISGKREQGQLRIWGKELLPLTSTPPTKDQRVLSDLSLDEAWVLCDAIKRLESSGKFERLKMSWSALFRGLRERQEPWEAIHQYVRVLEGLTGGGSDKVGAEDFGKMLDPHIKSVPGDLKRAYKLRNFVEHMKPFDSIPSIWGRENLSYDEAFDRAQSLANWLEVVACRMMIRFLTHPDAETKFSTSQGLIEMADASAIKREWPQSIDVASVWRSWRREAKIAGYTPDEQID